MSSTKSNQLAKLSQMAQMQPFLSSSGGSLRTRQKVDRIIKRVSVDSSSGSCLEEVPIERTLSCPARTKKNENEREYSDCPQVPNEECESGAESLTTSTSSLTCRSSDTVSTRAGRSRVVVVPTLPGCLETLERDSESCSSSESRSEQRARRFTWGSVMTAEGGSFAIVPLSEREVSTSEDSGVESGVEERTDKAAKKRERRLKGRSLQLAHGVLGDEVTGKSGLRRSKDTADLVTKEGRSGDLAKLKVTQSCDSITYEKKGGFLSPKKKADDDAGSGKLGSKRSKEKKREDSKREKREKRELKAKEKESKKREEKGADDGLPSGPITVRRTMTLQSDMPASPRSGLSVQCLLKVGDNVWAADFSGRVTVFNAKGDVEKEITVSTKRLYSMVLVDKKQVWISGEDPTIRVFHASKCKKIKELQSHRSMVRCLEVIRTGDKTQVWSGDIGGNVIVWDTQKLKKDTEFCVQQGEAIFSMVALSNSVWISAAGEIYRASMRKLEVETGWTAHNRPITDLLYLDSESLVLSCADDGIIRVWKEPTGVENYSSLQSEASLRPASLLREITTPSNVTAFCAASPCSNLLFCAGHADGTISLWDRDMKEIARVKGDRDDFGVRSLLTVRQEDGKAKNKRHGDTLWSATRDGSIHLWDWTPTPEGEHH